MAKYGSGSVGFFLVDGYDLKGALTQFTHDVEGLFEDITALGDTWRAQSPVGMRMASLTQQGWFDDASDSVNAALNGLQATSRIVGYSLAGNTIGQKATGVQGAYGGKYVRGPVRAGLVRSAAEYRVSGQIDEGVIVQHMTSQSADWNTQSSSVDNGASSSNGAVAYLWVKSLTLGGHSALDIKLRGSSDNVSFSDVTGGAFASVTTAPSAQRITISGTIARYLAIAGDFTGAGSPEATVVVVVCRG